MVMVTLCGCGVIGLLSRRKKGLQQGVEGRPIVAVVQAVSRRGFGAFVLDLGPGERSVTTR